MTKTQRNDYQRALRHLQSAMEIFGKISRENQKDWDVDNWATQVQAVIETDEGQSGLIPFLGIESMNYPSPMEND